MTRGRKPKTNAAKPFIKCSLELEPEHLALLDAIKEQLSTESRSVALRAVFDSGVLEDVEFCFADDDGEVEDVAPDKSVRAAPPQDTMKW